MDRILIRGGRPLSGEIAIGGAKNAALPLMAAGLLTPERLVLSNVPQLADIATMKSLIAQHGVAVEQPTNDGRTLCDRRRDRQHRGAVRHRAQDARVRARARPAGGARRRGAGQPARRLRHRHPPDRPPPERAGADGRDHPARRRLRACQRAAGPARGGHRARRAERGRDREPADGGEPGRRPDRHRQCRARAGDFRSRRLPGGDGRAHRGHRQRPPDRRGRGAAARRRRTPSSPTGSRPAPMPAPRRSPAARCFCATAGWIISARWRACWPRPGSR